MSNLKQFTSKTERVSTGEIVSALPADEAFFVSQGFLKCDGSILLKNSYPYLYQNIGSFVDNPGALGSTVTSGTSNNISSLAYGNNTFVYAGADGILASSSNAVTWTARTSGTSNNIGALIYANNTFVYAGESMLTEDQNTGNGGVISTSTNGINWTTPPIVPQITYVGGKTFTRQTNTTPALVSTAGLSGGIETEARIGDMIVIAVTVSEDYNVLIPPPDLVISGYTQVTSLSAVDTQRCTLWVGYIIAYDQSTRTSVTLPGTGIGDIASMTVALQVWRNATFDSATSTSTINTVLANPPPITTTSKYNTLLVAGAGASTGGGGPLYSAPYLSNFLTINAADNTRRSTIGLGSIAQSTIGTYDPDAFTFGAADGTAYSSVGATIALRPALTNALTYGNNTFVLAGDNGKLSTSSNAIAWRARTSGTTNTINTLTYANNTFVYAGDGGVLGTSSNAVTWVARTSGTANSINALIYGNNTFVYAGNGGVLATSPDAITWTARTSGTSNNINSLTYDNGLFVYVADGGVLGSSSNAVTWTVRTSGTSNNINALTSANGMYVYGGNLGTLGIYEPYTYDYNTEFSLPTSNTYFDLYIKS